MFWQEFNHLEFCQADLDLKQNQVKNNLAKALLLHNWTSDVFETVCNDASPAAHSVVKVLKWVRVLE